MLVTRSVYPHIPHVEISYSNRQDEERLNINQFEMIKLVWKLVIKSKERK